MGEEAGPGARGDGGERLRACHHRYVARSTDGRRTVLAHVPRGETDPAHWAAEAEQARRLCLSGLAPVAEDRRGRPAPWCAGDVRPRTAPARRNKQPDDHGWSDSTLARC
ncbi:hypothetical protein SGPA1_12529 [Streptomyces misionensis JCM 4497]